MNYNTYLDKIMKLGFETGRGNPNAFSEAFGEEGDTEDSNSHPVEGEKE